MLAEQQEARPFILLEAGASALLGLTIGCAVLLIVQSANGAAAAGLFGAVASFLALDRVAGPTCFSLDKFEVATFGPPAELELTLDQRVDGAGELLLDDPLPMPSADARVVQLFASVPLPTAGELQARIESHLQRRPAQAPEPLRLVADDSDALHDALAELRRSLR